MKQIYLEQHTFDSGHPAVYKVKKLVGSIAYLIGESLSVEIVEGLCEATVAWKVTITDHKRKGNRS